MKDYFATFAAYNAWANSSIYDAAAALSDAQFREDVGVFFRSLHGTLNHGLVADRIWLWRLTGEGVAPQRLDDTLFEDLAPLRRARESEDRRIVAYIQDLGVDAFNDTLRYSNTSGKEFEQNLSLVLGHFFNHQTHHRGHAHAALTQLTGKAPSLDLMYYLRR